MVLALGGIATLAPSASAKAVGSDLTTLTPSETVTCPRGTTCDLAQALGGNGTPFSPPTGVITEWSVKLGSVAPEGISLVVQDATGTAGARQGRRTVDVGPLRRASPNVVTSFPEGLPIHGDEAFGVRLVGGGRAATAATIMAPFFDEYHTLLLWDPPPPFQRRAMASSVFDHRRIALSIEVTPPRPGPCDPLNTFTGSGRGDEYGGFQHAGDVIYGRAGGDSLYGYTGADCVYGGKGDDRILGMDGADRLFGEAGRDDVRAGDGNDQVFVRDGKRDTVQCGDGHDSVKADSLDLVYRCERIRRG